MPADYKIDFQPLDLSNAARFLLGVENEKTQRMFAERNNRIQAASELRAQQEHEDRMAQEARKRRIESASAFLPESPLMRAAGRLRGTPNAAAALNPLAKEYGGQFQETPPNPDMHPLEQGAEGPVYQPSAEEMKPGLSLLLGGKSVPVHEDKETTGFGPEYDARYRNWLDAGIEPKQALALAASEFKADQGQKAIADRVAAQIGSRQDLQTDRQEFQRGENSKYRRTFEQAKELANINAGPKQQAAENQDVRTFMQAAKEAKAATGSAKDIATLKNIEKIGAELNSTSAAAQNAAVDTLAQIAQGGKAGMAVMNVFQKHSIGPVESAKDKLYQLTHNGAHSPEYIQAFRDAVTELTGVASEQRGRAMDAYDVAAGSKSQYAKRANVAPYVENERQAFQQELGLTPPKGKKQKAAHVVQMPDGSIQKFDANGARIE